MSTENFVKQRAIRRVEAIKYSAGRIKRKMTTAAGEKLKALQVRLDEYDVSLRALELEIRTGKPMRIGGTVITVPSGEVSLEGN